MTDEEVRTEKVEESPEDVLRKKAELTDNEGKEVTGATDRTQKDHSQNIFKRIINALKNKHRREAIYLGVIAGTAVSAAVIPGIGTGIVMGINVLMNAIRQVFSAGAVPPVDASKAVQAGVDVATQATTVADKIITPAMKVVDSHSGGGLFGALTEVTTKVATLPR